MDAKGQLDRLLRIQELVLGIRDARQVIDEGPARLEEIEARFRERNAEFVAVKDQHDEVDLDQRTRSGELGGLEQQRDHYKASLMEVKNQREYAAMLKEIDAVTAEIATHEEAILKDMEALEKLREELKAHEDHIQAEREIVERERAEVNAAVAAAEKALAKLTAERSAIEAELPASLRSAVEKLEASRQGVFLSKAENGTCQSCFVRVRPQMFQEIKLAKAVHTCGNCRRFLYYEPSLRSADAPSAEGGNGDASTDAADGGVSGTTTSEARAFNGGAV